MNAYTVEVIRDVPALRALASEWRTLEEESENRLPFRTFEWVDAWWQHFAEKRLSVRDDLEVRVVRDPSGKLVAAYPLMVTQRPAKGPLRVRYLHAMGADPNITELRGGLVHPQHEGPAHEALASHLSEHVRDFDWIEWSGLPQGSAAEQQLAQAPHVTWTRDIPNFILPLAPTWDDFRKGLKHNIRESLRKCYNSLKRDQHVFSLEVVEKPEEMERALGHFFHLHASRAQVTGTVVHRNVFDAGAARRFLVDVSERLARRGSTRVFLLSVAGEVLAMRIGYVLQDSIYLYYSGYDPDWGKYSIMTTLLAEAFKHSIEQGLKTANLSTGNDVSKTRWGPDERIYRDAVQLSPARKSRVIRDVYQRALAAKKDPRLRKLVARYLGRRQDGEEPAAS